MQADGQLLLAALRHYLSMGTAAEQREPLAHLRPVYNNGMEASGPKKETSNSRPELTAKTQAGAMQDLLTSVDGGFTLAGPKATGQGCFMIWMLEFSWRGEIFAFSSLFQRGSSRKFCTTWTGSM